MKLIILTTAYNCEKYIGKMIESLKSQTYTNWVCYITDDMSTDNTKKVALKSIGLDSRFEYVTNTIKRYQGGNYYYVLHNNWNANRGLFDQEDHTIYDSDICVEMDGDDWFAHDRVLARVVEEYSKSDIMMTRGGFAYWDGDRKPLRYDTVRRFDRIPLDTDEFKGAKQFIFPLKTWKVGLFRQIPKEDMIDPETGNFYQTGGDAAFFPSMAQIAGLDRIKFMDDEVLYIYNVENPINDFKVDKALQNRLQRQMLDFKKYEYNPKLKF